jgi:diaminopimelate epimerase
VELQFTKMHGLGNDFVVIDDRERVWDLDPGAVRWLADRNFGVGGDGVILVRPADDGVSDFFMLYHNADGSSAEMCGNGVRCFAKWLVDRGLVEGDTVAVQTLGGSRTIVVTLDDDGVMALARVDMGEPVFDPALIPTTFAAGTAVDHPVATPAGTVNVTALSMGNPHAVIWVDDVDEALLETVGPLVENAPSFPRKTNVEFAHVDAPDHIRLRVWERGVGETLACGTGACATAVAAAASGRTGREVTVELPGGELAIEWAADGHVYMTGPAEEVFRGVITLDDE